MTEQTEHLAPSRTVWRVFLGWLMQRSTLLGMALIVCAVLGVWLNLIDEGTATTLLVFGSGFLIPEDWAIARQIMTFMAPILTHKIAHHHALNAVPPPHTAPPAPAEQKTDEGGGNSPPPFS